MADRAGASARGDALDLDLDLDLDEPVTVEGGGDDRRGQDRPAAERGRASLGVGIA
ncbi:hypothetical protein ACH44C_11695 [Streptomyces purpureus]|uniref:hypothetical protein n=1 Tax=Streptomyces purpureus TaxID=1951 RepID=UPI000360170B|nr:hypothetical protein [Streptomyces purpureus]